MIEECPPEITQSLFDEETREANNVARSGFKMPALGPNPFARERDAAPATSATATAFSYGPPTPAPHVFVGMPPPQPQPPRVFVGMPPPQPPPPPPHLASRRALYDDHGRFVCYAPPTAWDHVVGDPRARARSDAGDRPGLAARLNAAEQQHRRVLSELHARRDEAIRSGTATEEQLADDDFVPATQF